jgi:CopA family copper-resistance protein
MVYKKIRQSSKPINLSRRRFVTGVTAGGLLVGAGMSPSAVFAHDHVQQQVQTLRGRKFRLTYSPMAVNFTGKDRTATAINGSVPAPILRLKEGDYVELNVTNQLAEDASIHWHGIILPSGQDGVPHVSDEFTGIKPGATFNYKFQVKQSGTYWYHSHSAFQEPLGAYGALIIDPIEPEPFSYERDYVVLLSDWSDEAPDNMYAKLKKLSAYYNFQERTIFDALNEISEKGWDGFWRSRGMWNQMRMSDRDISDVTGYSYTYLMNGQTPNDNWTGLFKRGEKIRLRFINAAAMTIFDVRIPGLKMTVVAADGQYIQPVTVDEFRLGAAETYDVIVEPSSEQAYSIFAQSIDRSGYSCGTLTPNASMKATVPALDNPIILGHDDMGMDRSNMDGMNHGGVNYGGMDHSGHDMSAMKHTPSYGSGAAGFGSNKPIVHQASEYGAHVDMLVDAPQYRIDDPGIGLRNNGRRVLTYADLKNFYKTSDPREPEREIDLHLTGNMKRYMWSINGVKFADSMPIQFKYGERLRINLINDTMMNHPMHLHGMWSELETGDADYIPRKHTVIVQPGAKLSYLVTADAMGSWAYHCHLFFHMLGMFRTVKVS